MMWLKEISIEVQLLEQKDMPTRIGAIKRGEVTVGELSTDLRMLWTLIMLKKRKVALMMVDERSGIGDAVNTATRDEMADKSRALVEIFWCCVRDELKLWGKEKSIGIRDGWVVVEFDVPENRFGELFKLDG